MTLPRSAYHEAPAPKPDDARIVAAIIAITDEFELDGYRRVTAELRARDLVVNAKKVRRLMRENGLSPKRRRRFVATTDSDHDQPIFANLAKDITADGPDRLWVADLTDVTIATGFVYLAVILDAWSRKVVGYALSRRIDARLALAALQAALRDATRHRVVFTIPIAAHSTRPRPIGNCCTSAVSLARWGGAATPTTTPRPRAS